MKERFARVESEEEKQIRAAGGKAGLESGVLRVVGKVRQAGARTYLLVIAADETRATSYNIDTGELTEFDDVLRYAKFGAWYPADRIEE